MITDGERSLLLAVVEAAYRCPVRVAGRGGGGLLGDAVSAEVAARRGVSPKTVRRQARKAIDALTAGTKSVAA